MLAWYFGYISCLKFDQAFIAWFTFSQRKCFCKAFIAWFTFFKELFCSLILLAFSLFSKEIQKLNWLSISQNLKGSHPVQPYVFNHAMFFGIFGHMFSAMISPLSFLLHISSIIFTVSFLLYDSGYGISFDFPLYIFLAEFSYLIFSNLYYTLS